MLRNDGSTSFEHAPEGTGLRYGPATFDGPARNLFSPAFTVTASGTDPSGESVATGLAAGSGVLYDEADSGTDPDAF